MTLKTCRPAFHASPTSPGWGSTSPSLSGAQPVLHPSAAEPAHPSGSEFQDQVISLSPRNAVFETPEALDGNSTADVLRVYHNIVDDGNALKTNIIPFY